MKYQIQNPLIFTLLLFLSSIKISFAGIGTYFANTTVYGGIILTDPTIAEVLGRDFHRVPQGVNGTQQDNAYMRHENAKRLMEELPFSIETWYSIYAPPCPRRKNKGNDRGVSMSHYQIWAEFVHFGRNLPSTSEQDIVVVFEDDAVIAVKDVKSSLLYELSQMSTDMLFLGWCYGRRHGLMPMCGHAYALTRLGAKKMLDNYDICHGQAMDAQWHHIAKYAGLTWRKAHPESYRHTKVGFEDNPDYFTRGIFVQKNGLVSFNHHGFQNNANG